MRKQFLRIALLICVLAVALSISAMAAEIVDSGACGNNLTWTLDDEGTLTISGRGEMYSNIPWYNYTREISQVVIENGLTTIGISAFENCTKLRTITIPDGVISIGERALYGCMNLTTVEIPDSVTTIGAQTFQGCTKLATVSLPDNMTIISRAVFSGCIGLKIITIPDHIVSIDSFAFYGCIGLTAITLPNYVTNIGDSAFSNCYGLENIVIPDSVTTIGNAAFRACRRFTAVQIPMAVTSIDTFTFQNCTALTAITIPASVTKIDAYSFQDCLNLTDVYYFGSKAQWNRIEIDNLGNGNEYLTNAQIHYNSTKPEPTPAFTLSAPVSSNREAITTANLATLTEIIIPVQYSGDTAQSVTVAVAFYDDNGRFTGFGIVSDSVSNGGKDVTVPIGGVTDAAQVKAFVLDTGLAPLCGAGAYEIPAA